jgi:hypothetical protein
MFENIVPIADVSKRIQIAEKTLRNWRYNRTYPQIFVKIGGKVFVDLNELANIITDQQKESKLSLKSNNS